MAASAIASTDAIASDATTHVDPHNSANWMIDFVSSSMNPAPRKKNCQDHAPASPRSVSMTAATENTSTIARTAP